MLGSRWTVGTAGEHVESYQKVQLPSRRLPRGLLGLTSMQEPEEKAGAHRQNSVPVCASRFLYKVMRKRFYRGRGCLRRKEIEHHRQSRLFPRSVLARPGLPELKRDGGCSAPGRPPKPSSSCFESINLSLIQ